jgi:hypothetical protein
VELVLVKFLPVKEGQEDVGETLVNYVDKMEDVFYFAQKVELTTRVASWGESFGVVGL